MKMEEVTLRKKIWVAVWLGGDCSCSRGFRACLATSMLTVVVTRKSSPPPRRCEGVFLRWQIHTTLTCPVLATQRDENLRLKRNKFDVYVCMSEIFPRRGEKETEGSVCLGQISVGRRILTGNVSWFSPGWLVWILGYC